MAFAASALQAVPAADLNNGNSLVVPSSAEKTALKSNMPSMLSAVKNQLNQQLFADFKDTLKSVDVTRANLKKGLESGMAKINREVP